MANNKSYGTQYSKGRTDEYRSGYVQAELPKGYLEGGYYKDKDDKKVLKKEYIVQYPSAIASTLSGKVDSDNGKKNKRSQIRKFYEYSLQIKELLQRKGGDFDLVEAELKRLIPYVKYAESRGTVSSLYADFIQKNVNTIHNVDDLNAFVKHFEAVVAYLPKEKN